MRKYLLLLLVIFPLVSFISCYEELVEVPITNKPPKTFISIFSDSTISQQQSSVRLHWWGDDPDGIIIGYFISFDDLNWKFTFSNDSLISFPIHGADTLYNFRVAATDNSGNGIYDVMLTSGGIEFGSEPFTDKNNNGKWDAGEPFIDCG
ncbi:MAG: fibronectin type III domain-containing protein, partial [Ignavibacteria bacterium]|nr:fibronectin type III domain-containing protein [Ignavibacteria bacterium]